MEVEVYVVKSHNPTSGKGSYHLMGVFYRKEDAQAFVDMQRINVPGGPPRAFTVHKFVEVA